MPRTCTVCRHQARTEVDRALVQGEPHRRIAKRWSLGEAAVQRHKAHIGAPVLAEWSASQAEVYAGLADYTAGLERDARRIAAEARAKGNARLELQALAASRAHVELLAKLATASQQLEPEERLARERQAEAARLVDATVEAVDELVVQGHLQPEVAQALREGIAKRLDCRQRMPRPTASLGRGPAALYAGSDARGPSRQGRSRLPTSLDRPHS